MIYLKLFFSFFQVGLFSIGGGYATLPLIQEQVVNTNHWLSMREFTDVITISQMTPGPVAINSATFVGIRIAGIPGALIATFGCIFPSCVIVMIVAYFYYKYRQLTVIQGILSGLRPAVVGLIAAAGFSILMLTLFGGAAVRPGQIDWKAAAIFTACLFILRKFKTDPTYVMLGSGAVGAIVYLMH